MHCVGNVSYHKFSHSGVSYRFSGKTLTSCKNLSLNINKCMTMGVTVLKFVMSSLANAFFIRDDEALCER